MALFSKRTTTAGLEHQIEGLRRDIAALGGLLARGGSTAIHDTRREAADYYAEFADTVARALPVIRRQSQLVERTVRDNPKQTAAAAGLVVLGLAALAILNRR